MKIEIRERVSVMNDDRGIVIGVGHCQKKYETLSPLEARTLGGFLIASADVADHDATVVDGGKA